MNKNIKNRITDGLLVILYSIVMVVNFTFLPLDTAFINAIIFSVLLVVIGIWFLCVEYRREKALKRNTQ